jgi:hypothetical protein
MTSSGRLILPTLRLARSLGVVVWILVTSGWQTVVWGNVRAGSVSLSGMPRSFRLLVRFGLLLTIGLLVVLLFSDVWRVASPLQPLLFFSDSLSGLYAPVVFVPVVIGLLALAWSYLLSGALHTPWAVKLAAVGLFALFDIGLVSNLFGSVLFELRMLTLGLPAGVPWSVVALALHMAGWLALLGLVAARWRRPARLDIEFPIVLAAVGLIFFTTFAGPALSTSQLQMQETATGIQLTQTLQAISIFLTPFFVIAGAEVAEFGLTVTSSVTTGLARRRRLQLPSGRSLWALGLGAFLFVRFVAQWINPLLEGEGPPWRWGAVVIGFVLMAFYLSGRRRQPRDLPRWVVPSAGILLYTTLLLVQLIATAALFGAIILITLELSGDWVLEVLYRVFGAFTQANEIFVCTLAFLAGLVLWVRARLRGAAAPPAARYAWLFAIWLLWWSQTRPGAVLGALTFRYEHLSALATPVLMIALLAVLLAGRLHAPDGRSLTFLTAAAVLAWVLEFQALLSDPLSPLFGLLGAEAVILSVSIYLNVMAAGNRFGLNESTPIFPRTSRALLYFGFALLTVTTVNWLAAAHHATALSANEQITSNGYIAVGLPLAFWALLSRHPSALGEPAAIEAPVSPEQSAAGQLRRV